MNPFSKSEKKEKSIFPKKRFSQNFLVNLKAARRIVDYLGLSHNEKVLEIGPGKGVLTQFLLEKAKKVYGVELDKNLCSYLQEKFKQNENLEIVNQDILKFDLKKLTDREGSLKVIGNIPYKVTTPILEYLNQNRATIDFAILTVQKEVAKRICAKPGTPDWSPLSIGIQLFSDPEILFILKPNSFFPPPKVDSAVIKLKFFKEPRIEIELPFFFDLVKSLFSQRRKNLLNSLSRTLNLNKDKLKVILKDEGIDFKRRGETLNLEELGKLVELISAGK
ncbi:MAG: 16S rRNA (adenine(1518)-N(6)/adenine(1519)-N(6))-dimethyltransferase RsmA [candidate division Zixibacteria bacterium]|nr:16S rRNA (adenine(1518)-N(6)/adenine(1519)-N(6))-dimethyltransferase RsmA [candidate division Zixibacteria bacterium]